MSGKYYRLKKNCALRGWDDLPYVIMDYEKQSAVFLTKNQAEAAFACNGSYDLSFPLLPGYFSEAAEELVSKGVAEECSKGEGLDDWQKYRRYHNPFVSSVFWEITGRCNYKCRHCYMSAPQNDLPHLSTASVLRIVDELAAAGVPEVTLTGGEPLIRTDFPQIIEALSANHIVIKQIFSNGALADERLLDLLESCGQHPDLVTSYDGAHGWHGWMRGVEGAQEKFERAVRLWRSRGLPVWVQTVLHKGNIEAIRDTVNYVADLGCTRLRLSPVDNEGEWRTNNGGNAITFEEFMEGIFAYLPAYYEDGMPVELIVSKCVMLDPAQPDKYRLLLMNNSPCRREAKLLSCKGRGIQITLDGHVIHCAGMGDDYLKMPPLVSDEAGAKTASLAELLGEGTPYQRTMSLTYGDLLDAGGECSSCEWFRYCRGGCRRNAFVYEGSMFAKDPVTCRLYKDGWVEKIKEAMKKANPSAVPSL